MEFFLGLPELDRTRLKLTTILSSRFRNRC